MSLDSLLVCRDAATLRTVKQVLADNDFGVQLLSESTAALKAVSEVRFDAVLIDCEVEGAGDVLKLLRQSRPNRNTIAFAISGASLPVPGAFPMGAHFVLSKPVSAEWLARNLRAALGPMMGERRRYFRYPLEVPVVLTAGSKEILGNSTNVSEGGMALRVHDAGSLSGTVSVKFELPGTGRAITAKGEVVWVDARGLAGIRFRSLGEGSQQNLEQWLNSRPPQRSA
jgi:DNA-binding NtrC family response regulator